MEKGYRTRQRDLILQFLMQHGDAHLCAEDLVEYLRQQGSPVGRATIYRALERLVNDGVVRKYPVEGAGACYQYVGRQDCRNHFHLKCTCCGALYHVECDYLDTVQRHIYEHHRFSIDQTKTVFYGICADCAQKEEICKD